jgi:hypothetical protein
MKRASALTSSELISHIYGSRRGGCKGLMRASGVNRSKLHLLAQNCTSTGGIDTSYAFR